MSGLSNIRLVSFDLDDTLIDTAGTVPARIRRMASEARTKFGISFATSTVNSAIEEALACDPDTRGDVLCREFNMERESSVTQELLGTYGATVFDYIQPFPDAAAVLESLSRRFVLALLTNGPRDLQMNKLRQTGLADYFTIALTSEDVGARKPDPRGFGVISERSGVPVSRCAHVGDSPVNDILGAESAGYAAAVFLRSSVPHLRPASWVPALAIDRLIELPSLF